MGMMGGCGLEFYSPLLFPLGHQGGGMGIPLAPLRFTKGEGPFVLRTFPREWGNPREG